MTAVSTEVERFWAECRRVRPDLATAEFRVRRFGSTPEGCRNLLNLIRAGEKTATFSLLWELEASGDPLPKRGDCFVVTDFDGVPGCAIRMINVSSVPYREVSAEQTRHEGPAAREVEAWRQVHWQHWATSLQRISRKPNEDMIVVFQHFEVLHSA